MPDAQQRGLSRLLSHTFWPLVRETAQGCWLRCLSNGWLAEITQVHLPFVGPSRESQIPWTLLENPISVYSRYLQNGNVLAAKVFIKQFTASLPKSFHTGSSSPIAVGSSDEVILRTDPIVNFAQIAVLTCQRAQGDKNKVMRESWVRLCGTYQSNNGLLAQPEVRKVRQF